jgi:hypothetical protein
MEQQILCYTLIDITETGVTRGQSKQRDQQRNWETILQVLGLRTQPIILHPPKLNTYITLTPDWDLGEFYEGDHSIWAFSFQAERNDYYDIKQLEDDFNEVPVILGLDETARFLLPVFHGFGTLKNIVFFTRNN